MMTVKSENERMKIAKVTKWDWRKLVVAIIAGGGTMHSGIARIDKVRIRYILIINKIYDKMNTDVYDEVCVYFMSVVLPLSYIVSVNEYGVGTNQFKCYRDCDEQ